MSFQTTVSQRAKDQLDRFLQSRAALESEAQAKGATVDAGIID